MVRTFLIIV